MKPQRKLTFVFDLYDFSESSELLLLRRGDVATQSHGHRVMQDL